MGPFPTKDIAKMLFKSVFHLADVLRMVQFCLHTGNTFVVDSAGNDVLKVAEVGIYVKRKTVHGYPPAAFYAQCTNFSCFCGVIGIEPHTGISRQSLSSDAVFTQCSNNSFFEKAQVSVDVGKKMIEV